MTTEKPFKPFSRGTRLPLPKGFANQHFLYQAEPPPVDKADIDLVAQQFNARAFETTLSAGLEAGEIVLLSTEDKNIFDAAGMAAMARLKEAACPKGIAVGSSELLACQWAGLHQDDAYAGKAFVSLVLHTGSSPYLVQSVHMYKRAGHKSASLELVQTNCPLSQGDVFVLDPTTPHSAVPVRPCDDALLLLLQFTINVPDEQSQALLMQAAPPAKEPTVWDPTFF